MGFGIEDTRKQPAPKVTDLIKDGSISLEDAFDWLRTIYEIRFFEEKVFDLLGQNIIKGASHLYAGEEAVAVGATAAIERGDVIGSTHRGHGHCGAIGNKYADTEEDRQNHWNQMMAELMGKETGYCKGRGGSMHIADVEGVSLGWAPAFGATAYDVYLGTNPDNLELLGQVTQTSYEDPDRRLVSETLHYWRVDTVKDGEVVVGPVWSFKTIPVFAVEEALVGWYKFELGEGITAVDWTRKGNEGFLVDNTKWIDNGYAGGALEFDGDGDYVQIPRVVEDDWTIMLWLRTEDLTQGGGGNRFRTNGSALIDGDFGPQLDNLAMTFKSGNTVAGCTIPGVGAGASLISNGEISDSQWHHVG